VLLVSFMLEMILPRSFYYRPTLTVARELIGAAAVADSDGMKLVDSSPRPKPTSGEKDLGCHAHVGKTNRNAVMFGPPGHAYVYFTYGNHWDVERRHRVRKDFPRLF